MTMMRTGNPFEVTPIMIAGGKGSGKYLLKTLLDGHDDLFVSPFHEMLINAFCSEDLDCDGFLDNDIEVIKTKLACKGHYFVLEKKSRLGKQPIDSIGTSFYLPFEFDFYAFDKSWTEELQHSPAKVTPEQVLGILYKHFNRFVKSVVSDDERFTKQCQQPKHYVCLSNSYPGAIKNFLDCFPNGKVVHVHRSLEDSINGLVQRKPTNDPLSKSFDINYLKEKYCNREFVKQIASLEVEAVTAEADTQRVRVISFEDFFEEPALMDEVMKYLGLPVQQINYIPSLFRVPLESITGVDQLIKPLDKDVDALSKDERRFIRKVASKIRS